MPVGDRHEHLHSQISKKVKRLLCFLSLICGVPLCFVEFSAILECVLFIPVCEDVFARAMESLFRIQDFGPKEKNLLS